MNGRSLSFLKGFYCSFDWKMIHASPSGYFRVMFKWLYRVDNIKIYRLLNT